MWVIPSVRWYLILILICIFLMLMLSIISCVYLNTYLFWWSVCLNLLPIFFNWVGFLLSFEFIYVDDMRYGLKFIWISSCSSTIYLRLSFFLWIAFASLSKPVNHICGCLYLWTYSVPMIFLSICLSWYQYHINLVTAAF